MNTHKLLTYALNSDNRLMYINDDKITVKTDNSEIKNTQDEEDKTKQKADDLNNTTVKPKTDNSNIKNTQKEEDNAQQKANDLTNTTIRPRSDSFNIDQLKNSEDNAQQSADNLNNNANLLLLFIMITNKNKMN